MCLLLTCICLYFGAYCVVDSNVCFVFFFFKQKTAYEMRISDWSSDVCSSDLLLDQFQPSAAVFVDDLAEHHASVAEIAPEVFRLHMVAEPRLARHVPPAPAAHARIDRWADALPWIMEPLQLQPMAAERGRSEEHTSELQSLMRISYTAFCLTQKPQTVRD